MNSRLPLLGQVNTRTEQKNTGNITSPKNIKKFIKCKFKKRYNFMQFPAKKPHYCVGKINLCNLYSYFSTFRGFLHFFQKQTFMKSCLNQSWELVVFDNPDHLLTISIVCTFNLRINAFSLN